MLLRDVENLEHSNLASLMRETYVVCIFLPVVSFIKYHVNGGGNCEPLGGGWHVAHVVLHVPVDVEARHQHRSCTTQKLPSKRGKSTTLYSYGSSAQPLVTLISVGAISRNVCTIEISLLSKSHALVRIQKYEERFNNKLFSNNTKRTR